MPFSGQERGAPRRMIQGEFSGRRVLVTGAGASIDRGIMMRLHIMGVLLMTAGEMKALEEGGNGGHSE